MVFPELHFLLIIETDLPIALACRDNILRESATLYIELTTIHDHMKMEVMAMANWP